MPKFSRNSKQKLLGCDMRLVVLFFRVVKFRDCTILDGRRDKATQNAYYEAGTTKVKYPYSKHNIIPLSKAVDVAPYFTKRGVSFNRYEVVEFGHYCLAMRDALGYRDVIRWGGDWNGDFLSLTDKEFLDAFHWEIVD